MDFDSLFDSFTKIKAAVIGDVMLDTYCWGHVERISPEAPVPVVTLDKREYRVGGAGNVALNLASLCAEVTAFSVLGQDEDAQVLSSLMERNNIRTTGLIQSASRKTTNKTRIISRNQQMIRLDSETTADLDPRDEELLLSKMQNFLSTEKPQVVILEDYNKGVLTQRVITAVIQLCRQHGVATAVDPKKKNFFAFQGVDIFKPNLKEVREGLNLPIEKVSLENLRNAHELLLAKIHHGVSFITLSEHGVFYQAKEKSSIIPAHFHNIADVSGAGDTVIAIASLVYAATRDVQLMAEVANIGGGLVCEQVGTVAIDKSRLLAECKRLLH